MGWIRGAARACGGALCVLLLGGGAAVWADADADAVRLLRARDMAANGQCEGALALAAPLADRLPSAQQLQGQCYLEQNDAPRALEALEAARSRDAGLDGVALDVAMARFHLGDFAGARIALDEAAPTSGDRAEYHLYNGLLLLQAADSSGAADSLDRARRIAPEAVEPTASYYAGLAWAGADEMDRARAAFDRVIADHPDTVWATEAERAKERVARGGSPSSWAWARLGVEWDDNVVLRGEGVRLPEEIGGEDDGRFVWLLHGGVELLQTETWAGGMTLTYFGSEHFDVDEFDEHYPVLGFWLDRRLGDATTLRFTYDVGHAWIGGDPFVWNHEAEAAVFHDWGERGRTKAYVRGVKRNFLFETFDEPEAVGGLCFSSRCGPAGIDEARLRNRDGVGLILGADHLWRLGTVNTELTTGARWHHYSTRGTEYDYQGPELWLATETQLPFDLEFRAFVSWADFDYRHPSTYPAVIPPGGTIFTPITSDKDEDLWRASGELEWFFADRWSLMARYAWSDVDSNVGLFDYSRWMVGLYVTYRFEEPLTP